MKPELTLLVWSVFLAFAQVLVAVQGAVNQVGVLALVQNRDNLPAITGWAGRAQRAHRNMLENLPLFAVLVLAAVVGERTGDLTLAGAHLFFWGRVAYAGIYIAGIPWLRTGVWFVSVIGMALIFVALL